MDKRPRLLERERDRRAGAQIGEKMKKAHKRIPKEVTDEEMREFEETHEVCGFARGEIERLRKKKGRA